MQLFLIKHLFTPASNFVPEQCGKRPLVNNGE
jgi:hypothetical protein